jgi:uncharacterized protein YhbP (UPF0306 family)
VAAHHSQRLPARNRIRRSLLRLLEGTPVCAVSTVGRGGRAHVHICYFAFSANLELFFLSDAGSRHAANLRMNRSAAIAVFSSDQTWGGPDRGAQLFGSCAPVPPSGRNRARRLYQQRFPTFRRDRVARELVLYRFSTRRAQVLDEREFGDAVLVQLRVPRQ